jgi:curved DNA-binding protein CbpA
LDNIIDSSFKSKELYEQLVRQYHPDRYVGDDAKMAMVQEIAAQIGQNRYDSKKLRELAEVAKRKLG